MMARRVHSDDPRWLPPLRILRRITLVKTPFPKTGNIYKFQGLSHGYHFPSYHIHSNQNLGLWEETTRPVDRMVKKQNHMQSGVIHRAKVGYFKSLGKDALFDDWVSTDENKTRSLFHYHIKISPTYMRNVNGVVVKASVYFYSWLESQFTYN